MIKKKVHHEEEADEKWLLPYSDMLTLLLALFIVMFAMSQVDKQKLQNFSEKFNVIFAGGSGLMDNNGNSVASDPSVNYGVVEEKQMSEIKKTLDKEISGSGYKDKVKITLEEGGLEISIQDAVLFKSGDAAVLIQVEPLLLKISKMLVGLDNHIKIAGHTDNVPMHNNKFRSNWDLSAIRAINVMNFMVKSGGIAQNKVSIEAYGEFAPKYDNATVEGRAKNRRVELYIVRKYLVNQQISKTNNKK